MAHLQPQLHPTLGFRPTGSVRGIHGAEDWRGFEREFILRDNGDIRAQASIYKTLALKRKMY